MPSENRLTRLYGSKDLFRALVDEDGACARGQWCSAATVKDEGDGNKLRIPARTTRAYCDACETRIRSCLGELPPAWHRLGAELGEPSRRVQDVRSPFGPRLPLRGDMDALQRDISATLAVWEARVRAVARLARVDVGRPVGTAVGVERGAAILAAHLGVLLALQPGWITRTLPLPAGKPGRPAPALSDDMVNIFGDDEIIRVGVDSITVMTRLGGTAAGLEILELHYRARSVLGETRAPREALDVPCRGCGAFALVEAEPPSDPAKTAPKSECTACQATMPEDEYKGWAKWYAGWAQGADLVCLRCQKGEHETCDAAYNCPCKRESHAVSVAA